MDRTGRGISLLLLTLLALPGGTRAAMAPFDIDIRELDREKPAAAPMKVTRISTTAEKAKKGGERAKKKRTAAASSDYLRYTVKPGDTIYKILMARLGMTEDEAERLIPEISRINKISNIRRLRVGQTLLIPVQGKGRKKAEVPAESATGSVPGAKESAPAGSGAPAPMAPAASAQARPGPPVITGAVPVPGTAAPAPAGTAAGKTATAQEPAGNNAEPEGVAAEQPQPEEVGPEQVESEKGEAATGGGETQESTQAPAKAEPHKAQPERPQSEEQGAEKAEGGDAAAERRQPEKEPPVNAPGAVTPGVAAPEPAAPDNAASAAAAPESAASGSAASGSAGPGAAAPETAAAPAAPAFVPPLVCSITDKDPGKIVEAVLNALSIPSTANKVIESEQGAETYGVKADRYFEYKGGRYIVSIGDRDPYNYTMIRLLEKAGYRVLVVGAAEDFTVVAEKVLRLVGIPYDYSRNLLPGVSQAATGYLVQQPGLAGGRRVLITRDQVDSRQQWAMKPGCLSK